MRSSSIRFLLILGSLALVGISIAQVYWVRKAFNQEKDHFHREVNSALNQVANDFFIMGKVAAPKSSPIRQLTGNYYVVLVNSPIDGNLLDYQLKSAFSARNLNVDFEYGIYDCNTECMVFDRYVSSNNGSIPERLSTLPVWNESNYYFGVYFPNKDRYVLNQMGIWTFTTLVLLIVILLFGYSLFVILKQKKLSELQKDFINNMTHEFRTPISTIEVASDVLKNPEIINEPKRLLTYASIINKENRRLKNQVDRVLQLASIENDGLVLDTSAVQIHDIINDTVGSLQNTDENVKIDLSLQATNDRVLGDNLHLTNLLYNLLDNAVKYSPNPKILISTINQGNKISLAIKDNGIGITANDQKRIFNRFFRVSTGNKHDAKGFGMGLSYVKTVVEEHGGKINIQSEPNIGTTFNITLKNDQ